MPLVVKDRVQETSTTTGTGTYTLAGAVTGYQSFSVIGNANKTYYAATDGTNWEVGIGTYTSSGTTLSRDSILESSNAGSAVNWGAGTKNIFVSWPADAATLNWATTATAAGTTVLTNQSAYFQYFTGTTTQTITLPVVSTLAEGWTFHITNNSTGNLTVNSSGGNLVITVIPGTTAMVTCILVTGTTAASWEAGYTDFSTATGTGAVVLATSPTITTPTLSGTVTGSDGLLTRVFLQDTGWDYFDSNTTSALDYVNGSVQRWAPSGSVTLSVTNWPPSGALGELLIEGINLGAATITWPTVNWITSNGTTTTTFSANGVTLQSSGTDWFLLWTRDAGTTVYGKFIR